ncbi:MAG: hypothetical protein CSA34_02735 [Desulfobulbus propionicus]|nr:MAG: hypothetical protein CSA34_02735 [Desulfobulbus propionicus]
MLQLYIIYCSVGAVAGILAGLLGIGGGLVIVPMLVFAFHLQHIPGDVTMHLALATSMASIIFTATSSFRAHHKRKAVRWDVVRRITPGILVGTFCGSYFTALVSTRSLKVIFILFLYTVASQMLLDLRPNPSRELPGRITMTGTGSLIGVISSLVGIGGGTMSVPFMTYCNVPLHHAIGTSAAIGLPIALAGTAGYITGGLRVANLPPLALGYVYLPALLGIATVSSITAPLGARLAHNLPVSQLKKFFAVLLFAIATKMLTELF